MVPLPVLVTIIAVAGASTAVDPGPSPVDGGLPPSKMAESIPGVPRLFRVDETLWCGAAPTEPDGLRSLRSRGVRTIISVDGAVPAHAAAAEMGVRYIHIPLSYGAISPDQRRALAAALASETDGKVYLHCHHGRHRSAAGAAVAAIGLGRLDQVEGLEILTRSGTDRAYEGLWSSVRSASRLASAPLPELARSLPNAVPPKSHVALMLEAQRSLDLLRKTPPDRRRVVEAARLAEALRAMQSQVIVEDHGPDYARLLNQSWQQAQRVETLLAQRDSIAAHEALRAVATSCTACHRLYRK